MKRKNSVFVLFMIGVSALFAGCCGRPVEVEEVYFETSPPCENRQYGYRDQWPPRGYQRVYRHDVPNRYYYEWNPYTNDAYRNMYNGRR